MSCLTYYLHTYLDDPSLSVAFIPFSCIWTTQGLVKQYVTDRPLGHFQFFLVAKSLSIPTILDYVCVSL